MADRLDDLLRRAAEKVEGEPQPETIAGIVAALGSPGPVRALPSLRLHVLLLCAIPLAVALGGACFLGLGGLHKLSSGQALWIFGALICLTAVASLFAAREMRPGATRFLAAGWLAVVTTLLVAAVFSVVFTHAGWVRFLAQGSICLRAGIVYAVFAAVLIGFVLRRGYAVNPSAAGLTIGTLGGFAGVTMLELHCTDFQTQHVLFWHTAVIPVSALLGLGVARIKVAVWSDHARRFRKAG
jgi:hypothetical protein